MTLSLDNKPPVEIAASRIRQKSNPLFNFDYRQEIEKQNRTANAVYSVILGMGILSAGTVLPTPIQNLQLSIHKPYNPIIEEQIRSTAATHFTSSPIQTNLSDVSLSDWQSPLTLNVFEEFAAQKTLKQQLSLKDARDLALKNFLAAENRQKLEREAEAKYWESFDSGDE